MHRRLQKVGQKKIYWEYWLDNEKWVGLSNSGKLDRTEILNAQFFILRNLIQYINMLKKGPGWSNKGQRIMKLSCSGIKGTNLDASKAG